MTSDPILGRRRQPHTSFDQKGHRGGHLAGMLQDLVGTESEDSGIGDQRLLIDMA